MTSISPIDWQAILPAACATCIVVYSELFTFLHRWKLFRCPMCLGFWVGALFMVLEMSVPTEPQFFIHRFWIAVRAGFITSVLSFVLYQVIIYAEKSGE